MTLILTMIAVPFLTFPVMASADDEDGVLGEMPAYVEGKLVNIGFTELPASAASSGSAGQPAAIIYESDQAVVAGFPFVSVLSAVPEQGSNLVWREVQISFAAGHAPRQFFSAEAVLAAVAAGEISLNETNVLYLCVPAPSAPSESP
jgi:hypothetical protein